MKISINWNSTFQTFAFLQNGQTEEKITDFLPRNFQPNGKCLSKWKIDERHCRHINIKCIQSNGRFVVN